MGHYHFNVQPFGLKDARKFRKTSHDSLIGASRKPRPSLPSWSNYCQQRSRRSFPKAQNGAKKAPSQKYELFQSKLSFLGHHISKNGLSVNKQKKKAIESSEAPKDKDALRSFLGLLGFYRNFVPNFIHTEEALLKVLRKNTKFSWEDKQETAYQELKVALLNAPILKIISKFWTSLFRCYRCKPIRTWTSSNA